MTAALAVQGAESAVTSAAAAEQVTTAPGSITQAAKSTQAVPRASRATPTRMGQKRSLVERTGTDLTGQKAPRAPSSARRGTGGSARRGSARGRRGSGRSFRGVKPTSTGGGAHKLVIAEFILCVVLIGISPIMTKKPSGGHVYVANDFVRLTAVCLLFFILALLSNTPRASKFAATFGALVTLGTMFNSYQALTAMANIFITQEGGKTIPVPTSEPTGPIVAEPAGGAGGTSVT